jgi:GNAT superfamily N-acetyltransferase
MVKPEIRYATNADEQQLLSLIRQYYAEDGYVFCEKRAHRAIKRLLADRALGRIWVMAAEHKIVGYVVLTLGFSLEYLGRDAFLDEIYVTPEWRGRGLGKRALRLVEDTCRELEVNALHLEVERDKMEVQRLYKRESFKEHARYLMTKWLLPPDQNV